MDLKFNELKCPCCKSEMEQGMVQLSQDVQMVKRCGSSKCDFWMIIVIPHKDYDYSVNRKLKSEKEFG